MFAEHITTARLILRRPKLADAKSILERYASKPEVTLRLAWPAHTCLADTEDFLGFAEAGWRAGDNFPYIIELAQTGEIIGSTGLSFETPYRASTGYVLAQDAWGKGYATEALQAMLNVAFESADICRVYALCDVEHTASARVLEKCGMLREGILKSHTVLPNLSPYPRDMLCYARVRQTLFGKLLA